jgi:hypothetical protein
MQQFLYRRIKKGREGGGVGLIFSSVKVCPEKINYIKWKFIFWCICKPAKRLLK